MAEPGGCILNDFVWGNLQFIQKHAHSFGWTWLKLAFAARMKIS